MPRQMTIKNEATGMVSVVKESLQTKSFRVALLAAFISQTPVADGVWKTLGLESLSLKVQKISERQDGMDKKLDNIHSDVNQLTNRVSGFEIDFNKYKSSRP